MGWSRPSVTSEPGYGYPSRKIFEASMSFGRHSGARQRGYSRNVQWRPSDAKFNRWRKNLMSSTTNTLSSKRCRRNASAPRRSRKGSPERRSSTTLAGVTRCFIRPSLSAPDVPFFARQSKGTTSCSSTVCGISGPAPALARGLGGVSARTQGAAAGLGRADNARSHPRYRR